MERTTEDTPTPSVYPTFLIIAAAIFVAFLFAELSLASRVFLGSVTAVPFAMIGVGNLFHIRSRADSWIKGPGSFLVFIGFLSMIMVGLALPIFYFGEHGETGRKLEEMNAFFAEAKVENEYRVELMDTEESGLALDESREVLVVQRDLGTDASIQQIRQEIEWLDEVDLYNRRLQFFESANDSWRRDPFVKDHSPDLLPIVVENTQGNAQALQAILTAAK